MQENTMCFSKLDKPGKDEKPQFMPSWTTIKTCPDGDSKRVAVCKNPYGYSLYFSQSNVF